MRQILAVAAPPLAMACAQNPASVYCHQQGGRQDIRISPGGPLGWCHLPDGRAVEEWALFHATHPRPATKDMTKGRLCR